MKSSDQCPDLEELAALADGQTDPGSREHLLEHLDSCEDCYEVFAETVRFSEEVDGVEQDSRNQGLWTSLSPVARAGLAAAAMLILLVASYAFLERSGLEAELEILRSEREEWLEEQDQMQHQIAMSFSQPEASGALPQQHLFEQTLSPSPGLRDASGCDPRRVCSTSGGYGSGQAQNLSSTNRPTLRQNPTQLRRWSCVSRVLSFRREPIG